jgi:REP element-mobilizing transposase RayT
MEIRWAAHLVWSPKYRKWIKQDYIRAEVEKIFLDVAEQHGFEI